MAIWFRDGQLDPGGATFLVLTWAGVIAAFVSPAVADSARVERVMGAAVVLQFALLAARPPGRHLLPDLQSHLLLRSMFPVAFILMAIFAVSIVVARPLLGRATFPVIVGLFAVAAASMLLASPHPPIDVVEFEREAAHALARGQNPYDLHFPNLYGDTAFFGAAFATAPLAWAKQVHCNYHDLIIGVLLCAVAAATPGAPGAEERTVP